MNDAAEALRGVDPAMVPDLVLGVLRALKLSDVVLDDLRRLSLIHISEPTRPY